MMDELEIFSKQLSDLIQENKNLKDHIKSTEEWFKLAICVNNKLQFRTTEKTIESIYKRFIDNTLICYSSSGINLIWNNLDPVTFEGRVVLGRTPVTIEEIDKIFNDKP